MAIRKQLNPRQMDLPSVNLGGTRQSEQAPLHSFARDLSPELRDLLMRNGMRWQWVSVGSAGT